MPARRRSVKGPVGGLRAGRQVLRAWAWSGRHELVSRPVRCKRDEWYLVRARPEHDARPNQASLLAVFLNGKRVLARRAVHLHAVGGALLGPELLGWLRTLPDATHLRLHLPEDAPRGRLAQIVLHNVSEPDPRSHPLANVPRWSTYRTPFPVERLVLPVGLCPLAGPLGRLPVQWARCPGSRDELARLASGAACVLDPLWVWKLQLRLVDLEKVASSAWLLIDLETLTRLVSQAGLAEARLVRHRSAHGIMSARVEYADVPTRGLALQDVVPFCTLDQAGRFSVRAVKTSPAWRRFADRAGLVTLLSCETPWEQRHRDALSLMRSTRGGSLIVTDLPWLAAGQYGPPLAPTLTGHLLRMHLGGGISEHVQYWNRRTEGDLLLRDILDLARRYPPLRAIRWTSSDPAVAHLGITLPSLHTPAAGHLLIRTGRIDNAGLHDGLPAEPMMILMKHLACQAREESAWARQHLGRQTVTWQFDSADGLRYAVSFEPAQWPDHRRLTTVRVRLGRPESPRLRGRGKVGAPTGDGMTIWLAEDEGLLGDRALAFQDALSRRLLRTIEQGGRADLELRLVSGDR